ncbi:WD repeat-containing protein CG11141 [Culicoides brevitarsis]|uniref:WD repeat-containing protein CG11141 n=1 Tax=Culicoides brevitarsis TaxID=469753 RepID=UPI00307BF270
MFDPENLKEWTPLDDLLSKIPIKSGLLKSVDQNLTCISVLPEFIALGTDSGMVLWYNRKTRDMQKLRTESSNAVTCLEIIDSVEYMVACGDETGRLSIFQIEKEHPPDVRVLLAKKPKPIERYTVNGVHKNTIKCLAWSKNGMKLFSGDKTGVVALTEIDYQSHTSHSKEIVNEFHEVVQLAVRETFLLCSTTFRTIICHKQQNDSWSVYQVGKKDRKTLCKLGAAFLGAKQSLSVITTRPGYRFWLSNLDGNVTQTLIFKEELTNKQYSSIPLLNPSKYPMTWTPLNFGVVYAYGEDRIVTFGDNVVYVINLKTLKIERVIDQLRGVIDIAINFPEIFVLETSRSVIRLSINPESMEKVTANYPLWTNEQDIDTVDAAEECLDLPPIVPFMPDGIPKALEKSHEMLCKKLEQFSHIDTSTDDPILFQTRGGRKKSKDRSRKSSTKSAPNIAALQKMNASQSENNKEDIKSELENIFSGEQDSYKSLSTYMDVSLYNNSDTSKADRELKERELAKELEIESVSLEPITSKPASTPTIDETQNMTWSYPVVQSTFISAPHTTESKKLIPHFNFDSASVSDDEKLLENNLSDDMKKVMIQSTTSVSSKKAPSSTMSKSMYDQPSPSGVAVLEISDYMKIPNLWNKMEKVCDELEVAQEADDSADLSTEWEII